MTPIHSPRAAVLGALVLAGSIALLALPLAAAPPAANGPLPDAVVLADYLPAGTAYDPAIPVPASVLGFEVGAWHARPDQLVDYLGRLAEASPRVRVERFGTTHERRPQVVAVISSAANLARLDQILEAHRAVSEPAAAAPANDQPAVVYLGYSIHGNEASGANASLVVAYHLAAAEGPEIDRLLEQTVVLLDPALNPDGIGRFAHWANMYRGTRPVADPASREHAEEWPGGRTNHYWFDLNRDWLLVQQPESRARVALFQRWRPNVLADFHEMGSNSTYFFQPGVPSRQNPLTPARNLELTRDFARYHAAALDAAGSLYYTEEVFDDFYYGKGSTYPDVQGAVGILFEQASVRGHVRETDDGLATFPAAIANQVRTSLSTLAAAADKRQELLDYQREFYREAAREAASAAATAWVFGAPGDAARAAEMAAVLAAHDIAVHRLARPLTTAAAELAPGSAYVVPVAQRQSRLIEALFSTPTEFADTTFYDVSAWTLPLSYGLPYEAIDRPLGGLLGERVPAPGAAWPSVVPAGTAPGLAADTAHTADTPVAWAFDWTGYYAPRALYRLLEAGVRARVATRPFESAGHVFGEGTVVVPAGGQSLPPEQIAGLLAEAAGTDGVDIVPLASGLTPGGADLGSPSLPPAVRPRPLLVTGRGVSSYEAGEAWHLLDHRFGIEVALGDTGRLADTELDRYTHLLLVDGWYGDWGDDEAAAVRSWVRRGGILVATKGGAGWAERAVLGIDAAKDEGGGESGAAAAAAVAASPEAEPERRAYADFERDAARRLVAGTIFAAELDLTHPIAWGFVREELPVFRDHTGTLAPTADPYAVPVRYAAEPLLAGYASADNAERLGGRAAVIASRLGRGAVVRFADDPSFRGAWYGTSKLYLNALFFGGLIDNTSLPSEVAPPN